MNAYKVTVNVDGRDVESHVKDGILSSIETGLIRDGVEIPEYKVTILVGKSRTGPSAWIQVGHFDSNRNLIISHEGWAKGINSDIHSLRGSSHIRASLASEDELTHEMSSSLDKADFDLLSCCTANGSGCYVRCCGGCCSDAARCPGASCCP